MPFGRKEKTEVITDESHPEGFYPQDIAKVTGRRGPKVVEAEHEEKRPVKLYTKDSDVPAHMRRPMPPLAPRQTQGPTIKEMRAAIEKVVARNHERRKQEIMKTLKDPTNTTLVTKMAETNVYKKRHGEAPAEAEVQSEPRKQKSRRKGR